MHRSWAIVLVLGSIAAACDAPPTAASAGALSGGRDRGREQRGHRDDCDDDVDEGRDCDHLTARSSLERRRACASHTLATMEQTALVDAMAADAAEPAPDTIFVDAQLAALEAALVGVDDPDARMSLRSGALDKGYSELRANVDLLPSQFLSTAQALRTAILLSPAAQADADAAFARARACASPPGPFAAAAAPSCPPLAYVATEGDRAVARGIAPDVAAAHRASDPLPTALRPRRPVATRTVLTPAPGPTVAVDVGGAS